jgi:hypothetical protein
MRTTDAGYCLLLLWLPRSREVFELKSGGDLLDGRVTVERRDKDSLSGRTDHPEEQPVNHSNREAGEHSCVSELRADQREKQSRKPQKKKNQSEAESTDNFFAPRFAEQP